jgi:hypothetical protein
VSQVCHIFLVRFLVSPNDIYVPEVKCQGLGLEGGLKRVNEQQGQRGTSEIAARGLKVRGPSVVVLISKPLFSYG